MAGMANGPIPTKLTLLADLDSFPQSSKVRFLGCVVAYSTKSAILTLQHNHPPNNPVKALVDVRLLLKSLASNETQIGEWVNVMGYVTCNSSTKKDPAGRKDITIQAITLWGAKAFDLAGYERSLDEMKRIGVEQQQNR